MKRAGHAPHLQKSPWIDYLHRGYLILHKKFVLFTLTRINRKWRCLNKLTSKWLIHRINTDKEELENVLLDRMNIISRPVRESYGREGSFRATPAVTGGLIQQSVPCIRSPLTICRGHWYILFRDYQWLFHKNAHLVCLMSYLKNYVLSCLCVKFTQLSTYRTLTTVSDTSVKRN